MSKAWLTRASGGRIFRLPSIRALRAQREITFSERQISRGVDVFDPNTGQIRSNGIEGIAAWFIDDDYDEESFFVRQAYFLGAQYPYKALKTSLKSQIDAEAWESLYSPVSRPFAKPQSGRIAVKMMGV